MNTPNYIPLTVEETLLAANTLIEHLGWEPGFALHYATKGKTSVTYPLNERSFEGVEYKGMEHPVSLENGKWVTGLI